MYGYTMYGVLRVLFVFTLYIHIVHCLHGTVQLYMDTGLKQGKYIHHLPHRTLESSRKSRKLRSRKSGTAESRYRQDPANRESELRTPRRNLARTWHGLGADWVSALAFRCPAYNPHRLYSESMPPAPSRLAYNLPRTYRTFSNACLCLHSLPCAQATPYLPAFKVGCAPLYRKQRNLQSAWRHGEPADFGSRQDPPRAFQWRARSLAPDDEAIGLPRMSGG